MAQPSIWMKPKSSVDTLKEPRSPRRGTEQTHRFPWLEFRGQQETQWKSPGFLSEGSGLTSSRQPPMTASSLKDEPTTLFTCKTNYPIT